MKKGDFLLVGSGHNDEKAESGRYTNPNGDYKTAGSFANSLYENYIKPAQAAGTTVVLCTPIVRRTADGNWSDSQLHVTAAFQESLKEEVIHRQSLILEKILMFQWLI